jgi:hypothetical protein
VGLFGKKTPRDEPLTSTEAEILDFYRHLLNSTYGPSEYVDQTVVQGMHEAILESKADGTYWLPLDAGDLVLSGVQSRDPRLNAWVAGMRATLDLKRIDGMTDDDFRQYWNEPEVARRMAIVAMNLGRARLFGQALESRDWESMEQASAEAARHVGMFLGSFGHPTGTEDTSDPHRPLPLELHTRVIAFLDAASADSQLVRKKLQEAGTLNALYRASLRL